MRMRNMAQKSRSSYVAIPITRRIVPRNRYTMSTKVCLQTTSAILLRCMSLQLALFGHGRFGRRCPLLGEERKSHSRGVRSAFDPKRTNSPAYKKAPNDAEV